MVLASNEVVVVTSVASAETVLWGRRRNGKMKRTRRYAVQFFLVLRRCGPVGEVLLRCIVLCMCVSFAASSLSIAYCQNR